MMNGLTLLLAALLPVIPQPRQLPENADLGDEGYRLEIKNGEARIFAGTERGRLWARATLDQLKKAGALDDGVIVDKPKYRLRGITLDVGRKYVPLGYLYRLVGEMSAYKLNTLHLHLSDNEGTHHPKEADWQNMYAAFRLESTVCPELTAKDGSYTKDEFRAFMKYARAKGVTVVPEIDVPAHSLAFTHVRPEFASKEYGADHFDLSRSAEILPWLEEIFAEYLTGEDPVFIGPYCHVGTDEYNKKEAEKFRAFMDAMLKMVRKYGYKPCAWGSLAHAKGTTPVVADAGITMDIWCNPFFPPHEALAAGYSIVSVPDTKVYIVPRATWYHDFLNLKELYDEWEPCVVGDETVDPENPLLLGGKFALWCDRFKVTTVEDIEARLSHAIPTMAQKMWSGKVEGQTFEDFQKIK